MKTKPWLLQAGGFVAAICGGAAFNALHVPIGWVLGALIASAAWCNLTGAPGLGRDARRVALLLLGVATAAILTPALLAEMVTLLPLMVFAAIVVNVVALLLVRPFAHLVGVDRTTALCSVLPAGLAEMAGLAQDRGARVDVVTLAHTVRVTVLVMTVPFLVGAEDRVADPSAGEPLLTLACLAISGLLAWIMHRSGFVNPWIVVPIVVGMGVVLLGGTIAPIPKPIVILAQILIGASLGSKLSLADLLGRPRPLIAALFSTLALFVGALVCVGPPLLWVFGTGFSTTVLALAPGGLAEMLAAAKSVGANVPFVVGFQILRSLMTNSLAPVLLSRWGAQK
ncbi:AbrB family transcriptional regulator [Thioclava sp. FR2]|uniref:AbrB family transcriptional regulator n=1 Tax=Thioclava sp. FR2 TaxID=3445780 RepID=UPI003EBC1D1D